MKRKVVITGCGAVCSVGSNLNEYWDALISQTNVVAPILSFDSSIYRSPMGAEVNWDNIDRLLKQIQKFPIDEEASKLSVLAVHEAFLMAKLPESTRLKLEGRIGCIVGTLCSSSREQERSWKNILPPNPEQDATIVSYQADVISHHFKISGPTSLISTACASAIDAYGFALDLIRSGRCDVMVVVGGDIISEAVHAGFNAVYSVATDLPKPFDENRSGFVIGDGAGAIVIESEEYAISRGANILAYALGYGASNSAFHMTSPSDDGIPEALAMSRALEDSQLKFDQVDYVLAHGTGTHKNDKIEILAINKGLFPNKRTTPLKVSSIKGNIGHCMGAAGAMSMISAIMSLNNSVIPPTANVGNPDPAFKEFSGIELVYNNPSYLPINNILINSLGFAGNNAVAIIGKYQ